MNDSAIIQANKALQEATDQAFQSLSDLVSDHPGCRKDIDECYRELATLKLTTATLSHRVRNAPITALERLVDQLRESYKTICQIEALVGDHRKRECSHPSRCTLTRRHAYDTLVEKLESHNLLISSILGDTIHLVRPIRIRNSINPMQGADTIMTGLAQFRRGLNDSAIISVLDMLGIFALVMYHHPLLVSGLIIGAMPSRFLPPLENALRKSPNSMHGRILAGSFAVIAVLLFCFPSFFVGVIVADKLNYLERPLVAERDRDLDEPVLAPPGSSLADEPMPYSLAMPKPRQRSFLSDLGRALMTADDDAISERDQKKLRKPLLGLTRYTADDGHGSMPRERQPRRARADSYESSEPEELRRRSVALSPRRSEEMCKPPSGGGSAESRKAKSSGKQKARVDDGASIDGKERRTQRWDEDRRP